jgi:hypothetical protein
MPFFFNITGWGAEGPLPQTSLRLTADALSCALPRVPHLGGKSPTLPTAHERCGKMGTLGKDGSYPLIFDGRPGSWPPFKKALHQLLDKEDYGWAVEGRDVFCAMPQAASAKAAKSTVTSGKGTVSTNVADYAKNDLQAAFTNASATTSVLLELSLEDTEATLKRCEQHLQRAATDDASPKAKVLATEISGQDTAAELAALKATTKAQDAKIKALSAQLRGDTSGAKRARNGVTVEQEPIPVCLDPTEHTTIPPRYDHGPQCPHPAFYL